MYSLSCSQAPAVRSYYTESEEFDPQSQILFLEHNPPVSPNSHLARSLPFFLTKFSFYLPIRLFNF